MAAMTFRSFNTLNNGGGTAGAAAIDANSKSPGTRPILIGSKSINTTDILFVVALIVAMFWLEGRKA